MTKIINKKVRIGVIGLGYGLKVQLPCFHAIPGYEIIAIAGRSLEKARKTAEKANCGWYASNWKALMANPKIDAVSIAVPPVFQYEMVCTALDFGKHVLCEKPFGLNSIEAENMLQRAAQKDVVHAVDFEFRMDPVINKLHQLLGRRRIGRLQRIDVNWIAGGRAKQDLPWSWQNDTLSGGGTLNAFGIHVVDYIEWLCKSSIVSVSGARNRILLKRSNVPKKSRNTLAEDTCDFMCELVNGVIATVSISNVIPFGCGHRIDIYGDAGRLVYCYEKPYLPEDSGKLYIEDDGSGLRLIPVLAEGDEIFQSDFRCRPFFNLARSFHNKINGMCEKNLPDFAHAVRAWHVIEAIRQTTSKDRVVHISEGI